MTAATQAAASETIADRTRLRIMRRIMPYLFLLFIIAYVDRVNVGYAKLEMLGDLGFDEAIYGLGAGIFFIGYFLFEIPGSIIVEKWSARGWIARIMITWGLIVILMGFMHTETQFYLARFLLGAAEAGFFPGVIVYLSHWFRAADRAKAIAMFMAAVPVANVLGSPISGAMLGLDWLGMEGWRWMFILQGIPAVILGVVTIFYLTDWPHQAKWLPEDERAWLAEELEKEKRLKEQTRRVSAWQAFRQREVVLLTITYFLIVSGVYGLVFWLPTLVKRVSGASNLGVGLISALPYCVGLASILLMGWSSDRTGERRWHTAVPMMVASLGLFLGALFQDVVALAVAAFCIAAAGLHGYLPGFWALATSFLTGTAAAVSIGLINSVGNLGGFVGPYAVGYMTKVTGSFFPGTVYLAISALAAACVVLTIRHHVAKPEG
jgi:ACS family tartrate transporter-like MFS transporter